MNLERSNRIHIDTEIMRLGDSFCEWQPKILEIANEFRLEQPPQIQASVLQECALSVSFKGVERTTYRFWNQPVKYRLAGTGWSSACHRVAFSHDLI